MSRLTGDQFADTARALRKQQKEIDVDFDFGWAGIDNLMLPPDPNPAELTDHLCMHAGAYALWGALAKDAEAEVEEVVAKFDHWFAEHYVRAKEVMGKATEKAISAAIATGAIGEDEGEKKSIAKFYETWQSSIRKAKRNAAVLKVMQKAWDQKQLMLNALSRIIHAEMMSNSGARVDYDDSPTPRKRREDAVERPREERPESRKRKRPVEENEEIEL